MEREMFHRQGGSTGIKWVLMSYGQADQMVFYLYGYGFPNGKSTARVIVLIIPSTRDRL